MICPNWTVWPVWKNGLVFVYKQIGFQLRCCRLNLRYHTCFEQGVPLYLGQSIHEFHDFAITMNAEKYCELKESKRQGSDIERESRKRYKKK